MLRLETDFADRVATSPGSWKPGGNAGREAGMRNESSVEEKRKWLSGRW